MGSGRTALGKAHCLVGHFELVPAPCQESKCPTPSGVVVEGVVTPIEKVRSARRQLRMTLPASCRLRKSACDPFLDQRGADPVGSPAEKLTLVL